MAKSVLFDIQVKKVLSSSHLFILLLEMLYWLFLENKKVSMYMRSILSVIDRGILYTLSALLNVNTSTWLHSNTNCSFRIVSTDSGSHAVKISKTIWLYAICNAIHVLIKSSNCYKCQMISTVFSFQTLIVKSAHLYTLASTIYWNLNMKKYWPSGITAQLHSKITHLGLIFWRKI